MNRYFQLKEGYDGLVFYVKNPVMILDEHNRQIVQGQYATRWKGRRWPGYVSSEYGGLWYWTKVKSLREVEDKRVIAKLDKAFA
jgi:hypothetical protein